VCGLRANLQASQYRRLAVVFKNRAPQRQAASRGAYRISAMKPRILSPGNPLTWRTLPPDAGLSLTQDFRPATNDYTSIASIGPVSLIFPSRATLAAHEGPTLAPPVRKKLELPHSQTIPHTLLRPLSSFDLVVGRRWPHPAGTGNATIRPASAANSRRLYGTDSPPTS
jgi:hypothetical protein